MGLVQKLTLRHALIFISCKAYVTEWTKKLSCRYVQKELYQLRSLLVCNLLNSVDEVGNALKGKLASPNGNRTWSGQTRWIPLKIHTDSIVIFK